MKRKKTFKPQIESSAATILPNRRLAMEEVLTLPEDLFWAWAESDQPGDYEIMEATPEQDETLVRKANAYVASGKGY